MQIEGTKVLVVGMAKSGLATVEFLVQEGAIVRATDTRPLAELPEAAVMLARLNVPFQIQTPPLFQNVDRIVISPGVPFDLDLLQEAQRSGVPVAGEVELAGCFLQGQIIGITGANGKTTTTSLVGHILRESGIPVQVGGNIGTPAVSMVNSSRPDQWNVLELSSFQLEAIGSFRAHIGVALNVTPDHLDRHYNFASYAAAKGRLFETQQAKDFAVLNADDPTCVGYGALGHGKPLWFSLDRPVSPGAWMEGGWLLFDGQPFLETKDIPLRGRHNIENAIAAAAAARLAGVGLESIAAAVRTFPGVEHRLEFVRSVDGVDYYNDSKATNVDATLKAINAFQGPLWVILGGKDKGSDYTVLRDPLISKARGVLLIGAATEKIAKQLHGTVPLTYSGTLEAAIRTAYEGASEGDTVLLAPACASFDQYESFEHRGRDFKSLVAQLPTRR